MVELIAEVGINHNGSIDMAKKLIDIATSAGCHYVKFQKRDVETIFSKEELDAPRETPWGTTFREYRTALEFTKDQYDCLDAYCSMRDIGWFASVWDINSLSFIAEYPNCKFIKIPSALITNEGLLKACKYEKKKIILSTGMSTMGMVDNAVDILGREKIECIMHCTSTYPTKTEEMNLRCIETLQRVYPWAKIGFSNHHPGLIYTAMAAVLGAEMLEFHVTLDRASWGSDQSASIEPEGIFKIVKWTKGIELAMGDGVKRIYDSEIPILKKLRR
jgi:N-acetylneuraminate synthase